MEQWEYGTTILYSRDSPKSIEKNNEILNEWGKNQWELVSVVCTGIINTATYLGDLTAYFKRKKS